MATMEQDCRLTIYQAGGKAGAARRAHDQGMVSMHRDTARAAARLGGITIQERDRLYGAGYRGEDMD